MLRIFFTDWTSLSQHPIWGAAGGMKVQVIVLVVNTLIILFLSTFQFVVHTMIVGSIIAFYFYWLTSSCDEISERQDARVGRY